MIDFSVFTTSEWFATGTFGGSIIAAVSAIVCAMISKGGNKKSAEQNTALTGILTKVLDKTSEVKKLTSEVTNQANVVVETMTGAVEAFVKGLADNQAQNLNVAAFILECFNQSNLSDEKKAKLQVLFDQMFCTDNEALVAQLTEAKMAAETALAEQVEANKALEAECDDLRNQIANATNVPRKSRRV